MKVLTTFFLIKPLFLLILFLIYFIIFLPLGLILKILGKDFLRIKFNKKVNSYWIKKNKTSISMNNQS